LVKQNDVLNANQSKSETNNVTITIENKRAGIYDALRLGSGVDDTSKEETE